MTTISFKHNRPAHLFAPFLIIFLSACGGQTVPTVHSLTPTNIPIFTSTVTITPTFTATPVSTPTPFYQTKQVLLNYYSGGFHTYFDLVHEPSYTRLVLYADGQMILRGSLQKTLSKTEMDQFFARLKDLGFYALETDENGNSTKNLYTPDNPFEKISDGGFSCVLTTTGEKTRNICPYEPYEEYLVSEMKNVLKFLDEYPTTDMTPYIPDRIVLDVESVETIENFDKSFLSEDVIEWPKSLTRLRPKTPDYRMMYVQGFMAEKISAYIDSVRPEKGVNVFRQDGKDYVVLIDIILPHEEINFMYLQP